MAQVKISKAQQMVLDDAKKDIDFARAYETFEEWLRAGYARRGDKDYYINKLGYTEEKYNDMVAEWIKREEWKREYYEADKVGCPLVTANTRTLRKLEEMGLIEVVEEGGSYPDRIKVIGY